MAATLDAGDAPPLARPRSLANLFTAFTWLALQGFGGVLSVVQRELVENKRWMTREEFIEEWAVAQIMPGPNVVNLAITFGWRHFGWRGALVAIAGLLTCPLLLVLTLAVIYANFTDNPHVVGGLRGMASVAAGLIIATGLKLMPALKKNPMGVVACAVLGVIAFVAIAFLRLPLLWVLVVVGGLGCLLVYRKIA